MEILILSNIINLLDNSELLCNVFFLVNTHYFNMSQFSARPRGKFKTHVMDADGEREYRAVRPRPV